MINHKEIMKYLKITIHDNDFTSCYLLLGNLIKDMLWQNGYYPEYNPVDHRETDGKILTENDLSIIKDQISLLWYSIHDVNGYFRFGKTGRETTLKYINDHIKLELVDFNDVQSLLPDNAEDIYIPLFSKDFDILLI